MLETITHSLPLPLPAPAPAPAPAAAAAPPPLNRDYNSTSNTTSVSSQRQKPTHQDLHISLSKNHSHSINSSTYAYFLESCNCPNLGKQIHAHTLKTGFRGHEFVETKLLQMYGRCGCLEDANLLFDTMLLRNLYSWTAILSLYVDLGFFEEAFVLFEELRCEDIGLEFFVFPLVLKICSGFGSVKLGRQLHVVVIKYQFDLNIYVSNALIDMYGKCRSLDDAKRVLMAMPERDCVSWNSVATACAVNGMVREAFECLEKMSKLDNLMPNLVSWSAVIGGFSQSGYDEEAIEMLFRMRAEGLEPNAQTLASILPACARMEKLSLGKELHGYITRHGYMSNRYVVNGLIDFYRRCGDMESALELFSKFSVKNAVCWNTMIVGYSENGGIYKAKELFDQMERQGIKKDITSWNSMISGYVDNSMFDKALRMFRNLLMEDGNEPDSFTLGSVLTACADMASLRQGKEIHSYAIVKGLHTNTFVGGALVEMYSKCRDLEGAQLAFDEVTERDTATWNALISGYAHCNRIQCILNLVQQMKDDGFQPNVYTWNGILSGYAENGQHASVMLLFTEMQALNLRPDIYTVGIILSACSKLAAIEFGKQVHAYAIRCGYDCNTHIESALVDMYAKCASIKHAELVYDRISNPDFVPHNAMLTAYAMHGLGEDGIALFRRVLTHGFRPDHVTFLALLSSCAHAGAVETGREFFHLMGHYKVKPTIKHFTCMVDLLSRAGQLNEAYELIKNIPVEPDAVLWSALLAGCVFCCNVELGEIAAEKLIDLEPDNPGNYVLLANLYAYAGRWSDLARTREMTKNRGLQKSPGCSWIEDRGEVHVFLTRDMSHTKTKEIYSTLEHLTLQMKTEFVSRTC